MTQILPSWNLHSRGEDKKVNRQVKTTVNCSKYWKGKEEEDTGMENDRETSGSGKASLRW